LTEKTIEFIFPFYHGADRFGAGWLRDRENQGKAIAFCGGIVAIACLWKSAIGSSSYSIHLSPIAPPLTDN